MSNLSLIQKEILMLTGLCLIIFFCSGIYIYTAKSDYEGILRFHIIANSDSEEDQKLKLEVRDKVVGSLERDIADAADKKGVAVTENFTRTYVLENLNRINKMAEDTVRAEGYDYKTTAELGITYIPEKTYDDLVFPAGNYEALNIVIGSGKGHNWFCVIYPPLCLIGSDEHTDLELKSKIGELLQSHSGKNR